MEYKKWSYKANCPNYVDRSGVCSRDVAVYFKDGHKEHKLILNGKVNIKCFEIRQSRGCV